MDTKIIETPLGKSKIEIKEWLTGRDRRALRAVYLNKSEMKMGTKEPEFALSGSLIEEAENKAIEIVVVSIDGKKEDILNKLLNMRDEDYEFVMENINRITAEKKKK